ncbi:MAG: hypothetical protein ACK5HA_06425 [Planctomycetaceae bacterium]|jgi:hypothetical protein
MQQSSESGLGQFAGKFFVARGDWFPPSDWLRVLFVPLGYSAL